MIDSVSFWVGAAAGAAAIRIEGGPSRWPRRR
jgi:hypothetical protein